MTTAKVKFQGLPMIWDTEIKDLADSVSKQLLGSFGKLDICHICATLPELGMIARAVKFSLAAQKLHL